MFDLEFYPTPLSVLEMMQIDCKNKVVLEPSAGKGDIVDYVKSIGAKEVLACEHNEDLRKILDSKCKVISNDFFNVRSEQVSHIDIIVMNPPFSNGDKHIIHAYEIAPEGCEIYALCNYQTIDRYNRYSKLSKLISNYGFSENFENCFSTAERKTNVEIGYIKLFKPIVSKEADYSGFFMDDEDKSTCTESGIVSFNEVTAMVQRYVGAMKCFDELMEIKSKLEYSTNALGMSEYSINVGYNETVTTKEDFSKVIQKKSWTHIFEKMNLKKYVTTKVMRDINKFVETQTKIPFTEKNIYKMFNIIVGTSQETFNRATEEAIDHFTKYTSENRWGVEGWKTNSGYMLNEKFIVNRMCEPSWHNGNRVTLCLGVSLDAINDLTKVMCRLTGKNYDKIIDLHQLFRFKKDEFGKWQPRSGVDNGLTRGKWYSLDFFDIKCYLKGTIHFRFREKEHWYILNRAYGEVKGFTLSDSYK